MKPVVATSPGAFDEAATVPDEALGAVEDTERRVRIERLRGLLGKMIADERRRLAVRGPRVESSPEPLPGELVQTEFGAFHRVMEYLEPAHAHGHVPIVRALDVRPTAVASLALDELSLIHI